MHDPFFKEVLSYEPFLKKYAFTLTKDKDKAQDLLQDTYLSAHRFRHKYVEGGTMRGWLSIMMKRIYQTSVRRTWTRIYMTPFLEDEEGDVIEPASAGVPETQTGKIYADQVIEKMKELPDAMRVVIEGYAIGKTQEEIAEELGVPEGTVKSRIFRAQRKLKELIEA